MQELALLKTLADGRFHSGQQLAEDLNLSRSGVWKAVQRLSRYGLEIHAVRGKGYRAAYPLDLLSDNGIKEHLFDATRDKLAGLNILTETESTNRYLQAQSLLVPHPTAVLAECQTKGRGRRGRHWVSPFAANIYLSLSWRFPGGFSALEGLSLAIAVAVVNALQSLGVEGLGIKWPNDIYSQDAKLSGVLIDVAGEASGPVVAIIGVGLNVAMPSTEAEEIDQQWIDLNSIMHKAPSRNEVSAALINGMIDVLLQFEREGLESVLGKWREYDVSYGRPVTVHEMTGQTNGTSKGVDQTGALLVETDKGLRRFLSGEFSLRLQK